MFRFAFGKLGGLLEFQTAFFAVASKQPKYCVGMRGKIRQRFLDRDSQLRKLLEVLVCVARCFVFFHRYSIGLSSGAYDGNGYAVRRALCAAKKAVVEALV